MCGLEVARKPYIVQTLRLAHNCVRLVGYFCLTSKKSFIIKKKIIIIACQDYLAQHIKMALINEIIVMIIVIMVYIIMI